MSESIHAGHLPLWNPYINFGIPQYGDMSSGYWSPITWLMAATVGYNAYTFTIEVLLYILLGGLGMCVLAGKWATEKTATICAGLAYMCCGYMIGHLQHFNWLSGAAFLPWCIHAYLLLLNKFSLKQGVLTALLFYLLLSSAHPGIIICSFYLFAGIAIYKLVRKNKEENFKGRLLHTGKAHLLFLTALGLLSAGMISGYLDILPHFVRGEKISLEDSLSNPSTIQSWISTIIPFATVKNDSFYQTDPSMRNCYFSLTLLLFLLVSIVNKKSITQWLLLLTGIVFALLAAGGIFKTAAYHIIPFIGYVRLNGEFRLFSIICFILLAAIQLNTHIKNKELFQGKIKRIYFIIELLLFAIIITGIYGAVHYRESYFYSNNSFSSQAGVVAKLKYIVDHLSFYDCLWIQGLIQLFSIWFIKLSLIQQNWKLLVRITAINLIITSLMNIPYTGVGKASVAQVQHVLNKSPQGIPIPALQPINQNDTLTPAETDLVGNWSLYSKQPGTIKEAPYPISLKNMRDYFDKNNWGAALNFLNKPFVFCESYQETPSINIRSFTGNKVEVDVKNDEPTVLILQQNKYPHWYYYKDGKKTEVKAAGINCMSAPIKQGENNIVFSFEPVLIKRMTLLSFISLILIIGILVFITIKSPSPSSQKQSLRP